MLRVLVADKLADEGLGLLRGRPEVEHECKLGLSPAQLAEVVGGYDGLIIRSGVKVTAEVFARPGRLRAIARAGVGVDNVDLAAATRAGVLVMNTPDANTVSTAEHTFAMMLAVARHIPSACADLRAGGWNRARFEGAQLAGKSLGIVGLGRVGTAVARRALAFDMKVLAYDPFIQAESALSGGVRLVRSLAELMPRLDFLTIHSALTDSTRGLIGAGELAMARPGLRVVNCARGGLVDEAALAEAIGSGQVAAAALDVFEQEPPGKDHPLLGLPQVIATPHLAASTHEAQTAVSVEAVAALLDYLLRDEIRGACNVVGLPMHLSQRDRACADLVTRMGTILSALCDEGVTSVCLTTCGDALALLAPALRRFGLTALLAPFVSERLNVINVDEFARARSIAVRHAAEPQSAGPTDRVRLAVESAGRTHEIEGTVFVDGLPHILAIDGYPENLIPHGQMLLIFNDDRPGVIGHVGTTLGNRGINIADMALSRHDARALMVLTLDQPPPAEALEALAASPSILLLRSVMLPPLPSPARE